MAIPQETVCPFCRHDIDEISFVESAHFRAIYNVAPILPGHALIIPKLHVESVMDLSEAEFCEFMLLGKTAIRILEKVFLTTGFNWTIQEGEAAGQEVRHLHLHVIPRKGGDLPTPGGWYPILKRHESEIIDSVQRPRLTDQQLRSVVAHIREVGRS